MKKLIGYVRENYILLNISMVVVAIYLQLLCIINSLKKLNRYEKQ